MLKNEKGLSVQQEQAISLLSTGKSVTAVAEEVGVARQTVHKWINEPNFYRELERAVNNFSQELLLSAMGQLDEILRTGRAGDKLKAIQLILDMNGKISGNGQSINFIQNNTQQEKTVTIDDILKEIEGL